MKTIIKLLIFVFALAFFVPNLFFDTNIAKAENGKVVDISIDDQTMTVIENYHVINKFAVSTGKWDMPTPIGTFYVQNHILDAYSQPYDLYMPYWMGIGAGYGIHGLPYWKYSWGNVYEGVDHLGIRVSHGCIRLSVANAEWLYSWAPNGTTVIIHQGSGIQAQITPPDYDAIVTDQSPQNITIKPGETRELWVKIKNTGKNWWYNVGSYPIRLGTNRNYDHISSVANSSWISGNRAALIDRTGVEPGQEAMFKFTVTAPTQQMTYEEHFKPVADGHSWFADPNLDIVWKITVFEPEYSGEWFSQSDWPMLTEGDTKTLQIKYKNTGSKTWYNSGTNPIRLGTNNPIDRNSAFYNPTDWISANRPTTMDENEVKPGEIATFTFIVRAPLATGEFNEYFRPVVEGKTWLEDKGTFLKIYVVQKTDIFNASSTENDQTKSAN
jgi:hypothetical protein